MDIKSIGLLIRSARKSSGLSQDALAYATGLSRVYISNIETGSTGDIGVVALMKIADVLSIPMFSKIAEDGHMNAIEAVLGNINTSYKKKMLENDIKPVLTKGEIVSGFEGQILHLIDETPVSMLADFINEFSKAYGIQPKAIWKNLSAIAKETGSPNGFWRMF